MKEYSGYLDAVADFNADIIVLEAGKIPEESLLRGDWIVQTPLRGWEVPPQLREAPRGSLIRGSWGIFESST